MTSQRASEPVPRGNLDYAHYRAIHKHLFQDAYSWAGLPRSERISKVGNPFCFPANIDAQATKLFAELKQKNLLRGLIVRPLPRGQRSSWPNSTPFIRSVRATGVRSS